MTTCFVRIVFALLCVLSAVFGQSATAAIRNQASVTWTDVNGNSGSAQSNLVRARQPVSITYFTSDAYSTMARTAMAGKALYVQASANACNADHTGIDTVMIKIKSTRTGDNEQYSATETAADTGVFRIDSVVMPVADTRASGMNANDGMLEVAVDDELMATVQDCGMGEATASVLIDPSGTVFDSRTNAPVAGAIVTLIDVTGDGNGGHPGAPAQVVAMDGTTWYPNTVTTDADGRYIFPLVAPSLYQLNVVAPRNYTFPSKLAPGTLPAGRDIHLYGSFGGSFTVSLASGAVAIDLPVDSIPGALYLEKAASRATAEIADFIDYTIRIHNSGEVAIAGVAVEDRLPAGFTLEPGSVRMNGAKVADPAGAQGHLLTFAGGDMDIGTTNVLRYRVRVGPGALQGDGINRARATSVLPALASAEAAAKVKIEAGVFSEKGHIIGTIFADCDNNGLRGDGEAGVPGVRVYLEDGTYAVTDALGRYSFAEVRPRTHVAKVDLSTLPAGAALAILSNRNAGDAGSRFVDLRDGELAKADFAIAGCAAAVNDIIKARRTALEQELKAQVAAPAKAAAVVKTAADLETLDNTLGFVDLADGAVMAGTQATVRVKGGDGVSFGLRVNGAAVPDTRIGQRSTVAAKKMTSWEFIGVPLVAGRNVLEVEQRDQFGNARGTRRIAVVAPGPLARIRLELPKNSVAADGRTLATVRVHLEDASGVPVAARTPVTLEASLGQWQQADPDPRDPGLQAMIEGGSAEFALRTSLEAGEARLVVHTGNLQQTGAITFVPDLRPLVAAGVIDGTVSLSRISGNNTDPARSFDAFEDSLRNLSSAHGDTELAAAGRAAMFMKGSVGHDTLLTMAYDSEKKEATPLFRDQNPIAYYPTYGDDARRGFDAQSTSRLYVRAERQKSWLMYGDFTPPGVTPARNLGAYNRSLNGARGHYEANGLQVDAFASHDSTRQMVEEFAANGTSGPFQTGAAVMVINSERVEVIVRDRNQPGVLVSSRTQVRYADYDIEPLSGRILFRSPVASLDADLNPISIRISYEVDQGAPNFWVGGLAAQYEFNQYVAIGGSYVNDRNPIAATELASVNATIKPDDKTTVIVEAAQMDKLDKSGRAARVDATRVDGKLEAHVFAGRTDVAFDNQSASLPKGRVEAGARVNYAVTEHVKLMGEALHTADVATGASRDGVQAAVAYTFSGGVRVEAGMRKSREEAAANAVVAQPDLTSVRAKVSAQVPGLPQASVFAEAEQDIKDSGRRMAALGGEYRFNNGARVYGRHELISSLGSNYALNEGVQRNATVFGIDGDYMKDGRVFSEYRARGSDLSDRQAEAAIGLRNLWTIAEGVRAQTSFERVQVLAGSAANESIAATGAIEYSRDPAFKANARLELRHGQDSDGLLNTLGLSYKITDAWTFLGKNTLSATRSTNGTRSNELLQSGVAYRALASLGWNGLAKYEFRKEQDTGLADARRAVHMVAVNANWQPQRETVISGRYAAKKAEDRTAGLTSRAFAQLVSARVMHEVGRDWDVGATVSMLASAGQRARQFGAGIEAGYQVMKNTWVSAGYNVLGFRERDLAGAEATAKGAYVRLRMKFDERTLENLLSAKAFN
ncbi:putative repeat protein (TIGR01451 family) [Pseudoduganella lurida]|uniref:Putative repeat protein (TIGR01451 family) n=1 Tax=Pseudoduganella lurida TaxID=1036180 RepID=A0A562RM84_9BURK|nr:DUF11 domain-containing protein [Pseudoduganella lurida]TWI69724.1 putative repeat protein (TIGR01451 family) [Pseudoduganella lurida]